MKTSAELYGKRFGDNNITEAFQNKEFGIRVELEHEDQKSRQVAVLSVDEAKTLVTQLNNAINSRSKLER